MSNPIEDRYEGHFLDALDLPEDTLVAVIIESVADPGTEKDAAKKLIKNAILSFKGKKKRLIINTTNYKVLKAMFGRDPASWIGKTVNIQRRYLDAAHGFGVENTLCIRLIPPTGTHILKSTANFMGQPHPYGDVPKQHVMPSPDKLKKPEQTPAPPTGPETEWLNAVHAIKTAAGCGEFRTTLFLTVPAELKQIVNDALALHEAELSAKKGGAA